VIFFTPVCIFLGLFWLRLAYLKRYDGKPFQVPYLFGHRRIYDKTKQQLAMEGTVLLLFGVARRSRFFAGGAEKIAHPVLKGTVSWALAA
jgi:hypothetical protein